MKYYKNTKNDVYAFEDDSPSIPNLKDDMVAITEDEADAMLAEKRKPTKEQIIENNQVIVKSLINDVTLEIDILQDSIDLYMAEDGDADKLKKWRKYRVLLSRVNTTVENMELPEKPD